MLTRSLVSRLVVLQQAGALLVVLLFAVTTLTLAEDVLERSDMERLERSARHLTERIDHEYAERGTVIDAVHDVIEEDPLPEEGVRIEDPHGVVLLDTTPGGSTERGEARFPTGREDAPVLETASATARCRARVTVMGRPDARRVAMAYFRGALVLAACPILVAVLVVSRWASRRALSPLLEMTERALAASTNSPLRSIGATVGLAELDALTLAFNQLLERLDDAVDRERRFVSGASHELRTPLTVMAGELEGLRACEAWSGDAGAALERIDEQVRHTQELVEALLVLRRAQDESAREAAEFEPVNVSDSAREVAVMLTARYPARAGDLAITAPDEAFVSGHPVLLAAAIRNLLDNAFKFIAAGQAVRTTVSATLEHVRVIVEDAGPGIPESERDRVFDPFYRGARARSGAKGSGLGLPLLREVARMHGGDVRAERSDLGGARLVLTIPPWHSPTQSFLNET